VELSRFRDAMLQSALKGDARQQSALKRDAVRGYQSPINGADERPINGALSGVVSAAWTNGIASDDSERIPVHANATAGEVEPDGVNGESISLYGPGLHVAMPQTAPVVVGSIEEWRKLQTSGKLPRELGLVPTMGALHEGHLSLVRLSKRGSECTAVSLFVNPRQFAAHEDLGTYPRTWDTDLEKLASCGTDYVFAPTAANMYPPARSPSLMPYVDLAGADELGEGGARPGFFRGVGTVLTKLLNITQPAAIYMGQKDGMQCLVTQRLLADLNYDVRLVVGPTVREIDGLAMSSRNVYLSPLEREIAPLVYGALSAVEFSYNQGERSLSRLKTVAADLIGSEPKMTFEYLSFIDADTCVELSDEALSLRPPQPQGDSRMLNATGELIGRTLDQSVLVSIAVKLGTTRLIDNLILH